MTTNFPDNCSKVDYNPTWLNTCKRLTAIPGVDIICGDPSPPPTTGPCPNGYQRVDGVCVPIPGPPPTPCTGDGDCQNGTCIGGVCVPTPPPSPTPPPEPPEPTPEPTPCTGGSDCPAGQVCQGGVCVPEPSPDPPDPPPPSPPVVVEPPPEYVGKRLYWTIYWGRSNNRNQNFYCNDNRPSSVNEAQSSVFLYPIIAYGDAIRITLGEAVSGIRCHYYNSDDLAVEYPDQRYNTLAIRVEVRNDGEWTEAFYTETTAGYAGSIGAVTRPWEWLYSTPDRVETHFIESITLSVDFPQPGDPPPIDIPFPPA